MELKAAVHSQSQSCFCRVLRSFQLLQTTEVEVCSAHEQRHGMTG